MGKSRRLPTTLLLGLVVLSLAPAAAATDPPAPVSGFRSDMIGNIDHAAKELISLAEAMPAEKYSWRPAPGVRSVAEVYMHVAFSDFYIPSFLGVKVPEGVDRQMETKVTEKARVVEELKKSIAHVRSAIESTPDSDLDTKVKIFGLELSKRGVILLLGGHIHEHLGQSIAYARMNGVAPPWSASEGAPAKKPSGK